MFALTLILATAAALAIAPLRASDLLLANHSFESGLAGTWTQTFGAGNPNGSTTAVTEQSFDGATSLKIVDNDPAANFGIESAKLTASAGTTYTAYARVRIASGSADLYLRFYNNNGTTDTYLSGGFTTISTPTNQWTDIQVKLTAPANANRVSVLLYSAVGNTGTAYWDRVFLSREFSNLGVQVHDGAPNGTTFGKGAHAHKAFSVITGAGPYLPRLAVIDTNTESVISTITFPAETDPDLVLTGAWGATTDDHPDGNIYFGTYSNAALYRHVPGSSSITKVAAAPTTENSFIYDLASSGNTDGKIYGCTFAGGRIFKYTPTGGMVQLARSGFSTTAPFVTGLEYIRELDFDVAQEALYFSAGGNGTGDGVYRWDVVNGHFVNVIPTTSLANAIDVSGGRLFAQIGNMMHVVHVTENPDGTFASAVTDATFNSISPASPANTGKIYYVSLGSLHSYDISAKTSTNLSKSLGSSARVKRFTWIGGTLVGIVSLANKTYVMKYTPSTGAFSHNPVANPVQVPGVINEVQAGPDGKVYTSAYLTGGLGVYTPIRGDTNDGTADQFISGLSQIDRMASHNGKLYIGAYPGALLYEYNPSLAWGGGNPRLLINGTGNNQDRPKAIAFDGANKVFMGSVARTNMMDGAVTWYDFPTSTAGVLTVANQSVISLATWGTKLFAGTSIRPGYNATPIANSDAKIRVYNITATGLAYSTELNLPSPGTMNSVTKMITIGTGSAARIWGFADGYLFVLNPSTHAFDYFAQKFSISYGIGTYRDADLTLSAKDPAHLYGTIQGTTLFKINLSTKAVTTITGGADMASADALGDIYFNRTADETTLGRYTP